MIRFEGVNKWFGDLHVLRDVDGAVARGQVIVLCGRSGSGKSTLIRAVNRLEAIQKGRILVDGADVATQPDINGLRSRIGFVFQQFNLFPHLSVLQNVTLAPRRLRGVPAREADALAHELLAKVGLADKAAARPNQLSGGQRQRVAIALALAMQPPLMLFDEPTSALDPAMVGEVLAVMRGLAADGMTMMCVTHEMGFAAEVADEVWFMDSGAVIEKAPPRQFFDAPEHPSLQRFLKEILRAG